MHLTKTCKLKIHTHSLLTNKTSFLQQAMQRFLANKISAPLRQIERGVLAAGPPCDVFINHRGVDTKRTLASLLYDRLVQHKLHPFLDAKSMKAGDKIFESIGSAIRHCKVGIALFSPRYCESYSCLLELAFLVEGKKKVIPIFFDVKPSDLQFVGFEKCTPTENERFGRALDEAKYTVGLAFDSQNG